MSKKYKLKGARPSRSYKLDTTPEGVPFIELSDKICTMRIYQDGVQEFYKNGELVRKFDPTLKPIEPQAIQQIGDFEISQTSYGANIIYSPKIAKGGVIK